MVHFEDGIVKRQILHAAFQLLIIGGAETVEVLVVDAYGHHEMLELALGDALAPWHFLFGEEGIVDALAVIVLGVVHAIAKGHVLVEEL